MLGKFNKYKYSLSVLLSGILWGIISIFIKNMSNFNLTPLQIGSVRLIVSAILITLFVLAFDRSKFKIKLKDIWLFLGTGIFGLMFFDILYFYTVLNSEASIAVVLLYTSPIFVMIMSIIIFKEKITPIKIISLIITSFGILLVAGIFSSNYSITPLILLTGIGSGFTYALYSIFCKIAIKKYHQTTIILYTFILSSLGILPFCNIGGIIQVTIESPILILWMLGLSVVSTILPYIFYTYGLTGLEPSKASILATIEPLIGAIIGFTLFSEPMVISKVIGIILILIAIILLNINFKKKSTLPNHI